MIVNISEIHKVLGGILEVPIHLSPRSIEDLELEEPVSGWVRVENLGPRFHLTGELHTRARMDCSRCAGSFVVPLSVKLDECYAAGKDELAHDSTGELEDLNTFVFFGDEIDLIQTIRENLLLAVPWTPLCHEGCQGICPQCGANRNERECACSQEQD
ncbi:MAG: DUF177 domain-containing protein [Coprothermobacterota bacterium]|nr:DUF177 domain-containing protein [Coprothermobacterota bacterium]